MDKQKTINILVLVVIYLLGVITGGFALRANIRRHAIHKMSPPQMQGRHKMPGKHDMKDMKHHEDRMMGRLCDRLDLTEKQQSDVQACIDRYKPEIKGIRETISQHIKSLIISGKLAPGQRLNELELSEMFDVSRSPLREALLILERENLVEIIPPAA